MKKQIFISLLTFFLILNLPIIAKSQCILLDALTGDTSDFGNPGSPVPGLPKDPHPQEFLSFDDENYYVYGTNLHNREVRLAISKEITQLDEFLRTNYAQFIFNVWSYYWKIFQGFSYDSYTVLVSDTPSTNPGGWGLGFEWELSDAMDTCFMSRCEAYSCLAHEIFHAWNPNSLDTNRMQGWFTEGGTVYYTNRESTRIIY